MTHKSLNSSQKRVMMLILKGKRKHQKTPIKKTHRSVNKPFKSGIVSTKKKYVVRKEKNMFCMHPRRPY